jgi:hypothetical protein
MVVMFARTSADPAREDDVHLAVAHYGPELYGLALAITANQVDADDAYQSAWVDAMRHWDQLRVASKRRAWLAAIVARRRNAAGGSACSGCAGTSPSGTSWGWRPSWSGIRPWQPPSPN